MQESENPHRNEEAKRYESLQNARITLKTRVQSVPQSSRRSESLHFSHSFAHGPPTQQLEHDSPSEPIGQVCLQRLWYSCALLGQRYTIIQRHGLVSLIASGAAVWD